MEAIAPPELAEKWDNVGLQIGKRNWPVQKVVTALDPCPEVFRDAIHQQANLLITHHPLLFSPIKSIDLDSPVGAMIDDALKNRLAVYAAHTNLDSTADGLNDILAQRIGLTNIAVLLSAERPGESPKKNSLPVLQGLGRIGTLPQPTNLKTLALTIKKSLSLDHVAMVGNPEMAVYTIAVCTGSGAGLLSSVYASGAEVYVSGDLRYHDAREAEMNRLGLIDIGHFASEHLMVDALAARLTEVFNARGDSVIVQASHVENNPFVIL
jgi:dinuclear metal center YbgI/SA1388 family protein